ncbi:S9 family peptidase [Actinotignum sp. GS-2025b]|uniref:S9 family peptidase n=1 Tax=Actinotignum sp. GS-2025b TaxID=3427275 RepID=UPI003F48C6D0
MTIGPIAKKIPTERTFHGDTYVDNYEWLRDKSDPDVRALLDAENAYFREQTAGLGDLRDNLVAEFKARTKEADRALPYRVGDWWYYRRTFQDRQYPAMFRTPARGAARPDLNTSFPEFPVWDGNELALGEEFFLCGGFMPSPDGKLGAMSVDFTGDEHFTLRIFDIETGQIVDDSVRNIGYGLAWTADSSAVAYSRVDDSWRQWQVNLHRIGDFNDTILFQENDERFSVDHEQSRNGKWIIIRSASVTSSDVRFISTENIEQRVKILDRREGLEYTAEPAGDQVLIVHNANRPDFEVASAPLRTSTPEEWDPIFVPEEGERVDYVEAYAGHAVISMRSEGQTQLRVMRRERPLSAASAIGSTPPVAVTSDSGTVSGTDDAATVAPAQPAADMPAALGAPAPDAANAAPATPAANHGWSAPVAIPTGEGSFVETYPEGNWFTSRVVFTEQSILEPPTQKAFDPITGDIEVLRTLDIPGYDPSLYTQDAVWVTARDGVEIPLTVVRRADIHPDGTNPGYLYGYGSYEVSNEPYFSIYRLSLLDRGVVIGWSHIRGGGELGRRWYDDGKLLRKKNTFNDFVDSARWLIDSGWVAPDRLVAEGGSAGGLLIGAAINQAPELFRAVHAAVPFVDALTTILKPELPLTVGEWEEWGNPVASPEVYAYMKEYSPVENVREGVEYPAVLATTSLNDIRVLYVEPTKWVQVLREKTKPNPERPILERIEMVAGHAGKTGRYDAWRERAEEVAWMLDQVGATEVY